MNQPHHISCSSEICSRERGQTPPTQLKSSLASPPPRGWIAGGGVVGNGREEDRIQGLASGIDPSDGNGGCHHQLRKRVGGGGKKRVRSWRRQLGLVLAVVFEVGYVTYLSPLTINNKIKELTFLFCMRYTLFFFHGIFSHGASFDKFTSLLDEFGFK